jgi:UDP:flavonoid glycosyltransferase YjiC (YdhE family)
MPDPTVAGIEKQVTLHVGTWSSQLRPVAAGDLPALRTCGFARAGQLGTRTEVPPEVEAFLDAGPPPVVIGLGSVFSVIGGDILEELAMACAELGQRCLIVGHPAGKTTFPGDTLAVPYAPYHLVFPRAAAVVIHCGAGTTGEAMRSGRPIVAVPFGFDQFALSWQVELLGAGVRVSKSRRSRPHLVEALSRVIGDAALRAGAARLARQLEEEPDGVAVAVDLITKLRGSR